MDTGKPIGYWVKRLDELIEYQLDDTLRFLDINRRHWQTLNLIAAGGREASDVTDELAPFVESSDRAGRLLIELTEAGWLQRTDQSFSLTDSGRSQLEIAHRAVTAARAKAGEGLSPQDYETTLATLRVMCRNLDRAHQG